MKRNLGLFLATCMLVSACSKVEEKRFKKVPVSVSHISFKNELKDTPQLNILTYLYYYNGAGVASADFNNDGLVDLYFTSNQGEDKLYLNKGNLSFEDVTQKANISNVGNWTTGVTHVDINNDGLLDIYVCRVGNYRGLKGRNLLYVNQGVDSLGIPSFKEDALSYGLGFSGFSTQASFFDYDLDGDLDMYLMNHSVHPNRTYGKGSQRSVVDSLSGDRMYRNNGNHFTDVSSETGIFQGKSGYGLGLAISDLNNDGYPDIYIGNDFFENDYLYINQQDGTFKEHISSNEKSLGHTTHFSMGNDIADINNDGLTDIVSLDMLPEDLETYKTSGLEYAYPTYLYYLKNGYAPQFMQNTLHLNLGNNNFSEIGNLSGISATEWSWGSLLADYDNDGHKDLYVSNGIKGATNDMDFINFIANDNIQKRIDQGMAKEDMAFIDEMPEKKVPNYFFRNNGDLTFTNVTEAWFGKENSFSNGCIYADLDNDGDLDLVVNNINEEAYILQNTSVTKEKANFLKINFKGAQDNLFGVGTKIIGYQKSNIIAQEHFNTRGYLSAVSNTVHMGIGKDSILDSLKIVWPGGRYQTLKSVPAGMLTASFKNAQGDFYRMTKTGEESFLAQQDSLVPFEHIEPETVEFGRDPLIPFANSNNGPAISVEDFNGDGLDDVFISGAKKQASSLFIQNASGSFKSVQEEILKEDAMSEDVSHVFFDANADGKKDLLVVSGGNEFKTSERLQPRLYLNFAGSLQKDKNQFAGIAVNASKVVAVDYDNDGDMDITISSDQIPWQFGRTPQQYIFSNDSTGNFTDVTPEIAKEFQTIGNVKDVVWTDLDNNGYKDLIAVGHWMPISIFMNNGQQLVPAKENGLGNTAGWWNTLSADDFDKDGDVDFVVGNWGYNSKFKASKEKPIRLYSFDFDDNGTVEPLVTYYHKDKETPFASKDELVKQMPFLNKKFLSYASFAKADIESLFSVEKLKRAYKKEIYELGSCYFENDGKNNFKLRALPNMAQISTVYDILVDDFNSDGFNDLFLVGNNYEISTQLGRMDASHGLILQFDKEQGFNNIQHQNLDVSGPARTIKKIQVDSTEYVIIGINNHPLIFLQKQPPYVKGEH
ncbi:VCBS repeat-containing protein [Spongiimicrobium sp. 3-5]|uniref:VCBS repeat-containing protein n=1 Tax=Spongiimicrobium sp. 3-5 TaxID=3332596 RepID=UPI003980FC0C